MKKTHHEYNDQARRLGSEELEPMTWGEWLAVIGIAGFITVMIVETVIMLANRF